MLTPNERQSSAKSGVTKKKVISRNPTLLFVYSSLFLSSFWVETRSTPHKYISTEGRTKPQDKSVSFVFAEILVSATPPTVWCRDRFSLKTGERTVEPIIDYPSSSSSSVGRNLKDSSLARKQAGFFPSFPFADGSKAGNNRPRDFHRLPTVLLVRTDGRGKIKPLMWRSDITF